MPTTTTKETTITLNKLLRITINKGCVLYNKGIVKECYDLYYETAKYALSQGNIITKTTIGLKLIKATNECDDLFQKIKNMNVERKYKEGAWILRNCFDDILAMEKTSSSSSYYVDGGESTHGSSSGRAIAARKTTTTTSRRSLTNATSFLENGSSFYIGDLTIDDNTTTDASNSNTTKEDDDDDGDGDSSVVQQLKNSKKWKKESYLNDGWQDSLVENITDTEKGQSLAEIALLLKDCLLESNNDNSFFQLSNVISLLNEMSVADSQLDAIDKCNMLIKGGFLLPKMMDDDNTANYDNSVFDYDNIDKFYRLASKEEIQSSLDNIISNPETEIIGSDYHILMIALDTVLKEEEEKDKDNSKKRRSSSSFLTADKDTTREILQHLPEEIVEHGKELANIALEIEKIVDISNRKYHLKTYENCFIGKDAVSQIISEPSILKVTTREEAISVLDDLVKVGLIHHVTNEHEFKDKYLFYRFAPISEIKQLLDDISKESILKTAPTDVGSSSDVVAERTKYVALSYRYKQYASTLQIPDILNLFYGCNDKDGWDVVDLENWRNNMKRWGFGRRDAQDDDMVTKLAPLCYDVDPNEWDVSNDPEWESPWGILAQIAIFDQIPRSAFRGTSDAFKWDDIAIRASKVAIEKGYFDNAYKSTLNQFLILLPLEHSESWEDQKLGVSLLLKLLSKVSIVDDGLSDYEIVKRLEFSKRLTTAFLEHAQVVVKFKRFPHRNRPLGRNTKLEERIWLASDLVPGWAKSQNPENADGTSNNNNIIKLPVIPLKKLTKK